MKMLFRPRLKDVAVWLVILGAPLAYWLQNRAYSGPVFLADEIGYLANAAFLSGHLIDGASSYYAGYSLFLAPLFAMFSQPGDVWQGIMVINAGFWVFSFFILHRLLLIWFPKSSSGQRFLALLFAALYPSWITMAGYAFATSAFVFVFMCGLWALSKWNPRETLSIVPHSLCVGFLYWVHPTGLAAALSSLALVAIVAVRSRNLRPLATHALILLGMVVLYDQVVQPFLVASMTPSGYLPVLTPYVERLVALVKDLGAWSRLITMALGHLSYLIVATFGLFILIAMSCLRLAGEVVSRPLESLYASRSRMAFYMLAVVFLVAAMGSLSLSSFGAVRVDEWIHGRYLDHVALPLVAFGFMSITDYGFKLRVTYATAAGLFVSAIGLAIGAVGTYSAGNAIMDTPGFWPQYLLTKPNFFLWMAMGMVAMLVVAVGGKYVALLLVLASFLVSGSRQSAWHQQLLSWNARPSSLVEVVRANFPLGSCIGYDLVGAVDKGDFSSVRYSLYEFYFFNYRYRRMMPDEWLSGCDGPYLTFNAQRFIDDERVMIVGREGFTGLFLVTKSGIGTLRIPDTALKAQDMYLAEHSGAACLFVGCFSMTAFDLAQFSLVGRLEGEYLVTDNRANFLFYGPYLKLSKGSYYLILHGQFEKVADAVLDILDSRSTYHESQLCSYGLDASDELIVPFRLDSDAVDFQVRLRVSQADQLSVSGYEVVSAENRTLMPSKAGLCVHAGALSVVPRQVGITDGSIISSNQQAGILVYGPYAPLSAGQYHLIVRGSAPQVSSAWVDVVSNRATVQYLRLPISTVPDASPGVIAEGWLRLAAPVDDIEVRVYVGAEDVVSLTGYDLLPVDH